MQDLDGEAAKAEHVLATHIAAMEHAAVTIEEILGNWAQQWCRSTVQGAVARDPHRTHELQASSTYEQFLDDVVQLETDLPRRLQSALRATAWRHRFVAAGGDGAAKTMADLDYGVWPDSGYKIPPAYEATVSGVFSRVTQVLRKYGYRPEFGSMAARPRYSAPPEAIPAMEAYYRLATRLTEIATAAEQVRRRAAGRISDPSWDRE
jgi:hypothetical protein